MIEIANGRQEFDRVIVDYGDDGIIEATYVSTSSVIIDQSYAQLGDSSAEYIDDVAAACNVLLAAGIDAGRFELALLTDSEHDDWLLVVDRQFEAQARAALQAACDAHLGPEFDEPLPDPEGEAADREIDDRKIRAADGSQAAPGLGTQATGSYRNGRLLSGRQSYLCL